MFQIMRMLRTCRREMGVVEENGMTFGAAPIGLGINCGEMRNWARVANYALQNKPQTAMMEYGVSLVTLMEFASICVTVSDQFRFISDLRAVILLPYSVRGGMAGVKLNVTKRGIKSGTQDNGWWGLQSFWQYGFFPVLDIIDPVLSDLSPVTPDCIFGAWAGAHTTIC